MVAYERWSQPEVRLYNKSKLIRSKISSSKYGNLPRKLRKVRVKKVRVIIIIIIIIIKLNKFHLKADDSTLFIVLPIPT